VRHLRQAQGTTLSGACIYTASQKRVGSDGLAVFLRRFYPELRLLRISGLLTKDLGFALANERGAYFYY